MNRTILITLLVLVLPVFLNAQINWTKHTIDDNFNGASCVYAADINGDSILDVLGAADTDDDITWWENADTVGTTWIEHTVAGTFDRAWAVYAADIDGDGDLDVLGAALTADDIIWWENADTVGTTWIEHIVDATFDGANAVYAADMDGDGDLDILGAATTADDVTWWENADTVGTTWIEHTVDGAFDGAFAVYAEDVDGDDDMDVLSAATGGDEITWWENADTVGTTWIEHTIDGTLTGALAVYAVDIDGDQDIDVIGAAYQDNGVYFWENADTVGTTWIEHTVDDNFDYVWCVYAADIDDDGDMDVLGAGQVSEAINWWENADTVGTTWIEHTVDSTLTLPRHVYAADIDGDGDLDVLGADNGLDDIIWWESDLDPSDVYDVTTISIDIDSPQPENTTLSPQATVKNLGTLMETFDVTCEIDPGAYSSTETVTDLASGDSIQVTFSPDFTFATGSYTVTVYTQLAGDENPANDTLEKVIDTYDPGVTEGDSDMSKTFTFSAPTISRGRINIEFALPVATMVDLLIYDVTGRLSETLISQRFSGGTHNLNVNLELPTGVYFYNLKTTSGEHVIKKFLLIE